MLHPTSVMAIGVFVAMMNFLAISNAAVANPLSPVPDATFQKLDGTPITLSDLRGAVVLINFWGTWCGPCLQEIPHLVRLAHQLKTKGLEVIGIALDSGHPNDIQAQYMTKTPQIIKLPLRPGPSKQEKKKQGK